MNSSWQRCRVHFMRNLHTAVSAKHAPAVTAAVKTIFARTDPEEVAAQWDRVADTLAASFPKVAAMMNDAKTDVLAFTVFPKAHWQKIWSNNPIERPTRRSSAAPMSGDLPQPNGVPAPGDRGGHRSPRPAASHPPLPLRCLDGRTTRRHRRQTRRRSSCQTTPNHQAFNTTH